ncbi:MAG: DUF4179 domain-containing protein [Lachnospiraceae bacterium]|nr:DUF4179 domain-containing protein [Lachnospiraceae bacterium]
MIRKEVENMINNINEKYVQEAGEYVLNNGKGKDKNRIIRRTATIAAALAFCFIISVPALSAAGVQPAYIILHNTFPEVARKLKPINLSCEDNGIKMEVLSANVHDNTADIYIAIQDITGDRINENIDLFDSYDIEPSYDCVAHCELVDYNDTIKMATFLIQIEQCDNYKISGKKITFSIDRFLSKKQEYNEALSQNILKNVSKNPVTQSNVSVKGCSGMSINPDVDPLDSVKHYLKEDEKNSYSPVDGVTVTAAGFVDGKLHIQVYYNDVLKTDNHGELYLKDSNNNIINYEYGISFWDKEKCGSYEEYIFDISSETKLDNYTLYGDFTVCNSLTEGNWQVTFPIKNINK